VKGIKDPWRVTDSDTPIKIDLKDKDLDADLKVPGLYSLSCMSGSINIKHVDVVSDNDGLKLLCLFLRRITNDTTLQKLFDEWDLKLNLIFSDTTPVGLHTRTGQGYKFPCAIQFEEDNWDTAILKLMHVLKQLDTQWPGILKKNHIFLSKRA